MNRQMNRAIPTVAAIGWLAGAALAQHTWDGSCMTDFWHTTCAGPENNWTAPTLPGPVDTVSIPRTAPDVRIFGGLAQAFTLSCQSGLIITNGGQLRLSDGGSQVTDLSVTNSSINLVTPATVLEMMGNCSLAGASLVGSGELFNVGTLTGFSLTLNNSSKFTNGSGSQATIPRLVVPPNCTVLNEGGATLTMDVNTAATGVTSNGLFINSGTFIVRHNGQGGSFTMQPTMQQTGGTFIVRGASSTSGTNLGGPCLFSDGSIQLEDDANLRFNSSAPMIMEGLFSISGNGNVFIQTPPFAGSDWAVTAPLTVNLSGSQGFVLNGSKITLSDVLTNTGKALWVSNEMRQSACTDCDPKFLNQSADFTINTNSTSNAAFLDTNFRNEGVVTQRLGNLVLEDDGEFFNQGQYRLISGDMRPSISSVVSRFDTSGAFIKPDDANTTDSQITTVFGLSGPGSIHVQDHMLSFGTEGAGQGLFMEQGLITVDSGATVRFNGGTHLAEAGDSLITGGGRAAVEASGGFVNLVVNEDATLTLSLGGKAPNGAFLNPGGRLGGPGPLINTGVLNWNGGRIGAALPPPQSTALVANVINSGVTHISSGSVIGSSPLTPAAFTNADVGIVDLTNGITLTNGLITNHGQWDCLFLTGSIDISGSAPNARFINDIDGTFTVNGALLQASVVVTAQFTNRGTVHVKPFGRLQLNSLTGLTGQTLTEGTWIIDPLGSISFPGSVIVTNIGRDGSLTGNDASCPDVDPQFNDGELTCNGSWGCSNDFENTGDFTCDAGTFDCPDDFLNDGGTCTINEGATCSVGGTCSNEEGTITLNGGTFECDQAINNGPPPPPIVLSFLEEYTTVSVAGGAPAPGGFVCQSLNNNNGGVIRPGGPLAPGSFHITGNFHQFTGGRVQIELGGATPIALHDQVIINGNATLGGLVEVSFLPPFTPTTGQQFTILTTSGGGTITGQFSQVSGPGLFSLSYSPTNVVLTFNGAAPPGDLTGDGVVNTLDLGILLSSWSIPPTAPACGGALPCAADINHDGFVNTLDLGMLLSSWTL